MDKIKSKRLSDLSAMNRLFYFGITDIKHIDSNIINKI